jgi:serine/threonine-protein kinase
VTAIEIPTPDPRTFDDASRPFAEAVSSRFAVKRLLGKGGMGMVFLARDRRLDRLVALKTLPPNLAADAAVRERFLRETKTTGGLAHANIVAIHGADEIDGHVFFVMAYVDGDSLAARTRALGRLSAPNVARYMRDVASALSHAHERGIIHRDIKGENILIERRTDRALVTDFGIARMAEASPLTATGQVLGTVHYMSPEQVSGEPIDARSDLYSLGVVGFFALTGRFPFDAEVASAVLVQHVTHSAPPVASINHDTPPAMATIIDRCLRRDKSHRFSSAEELMAALDAAMPSLGKPVLVSDTEAHAVWQRAAEMQAHTGVQAGPGNAKRPATPPARKKDGPRGPGFVVGDVVAAASEAGIDERYVERALAERGLAGRVEPAAPLAKAVPPGPEERHKNWPFVRHKTTFLEKVEGELPAAHIDRLLNVLRDQTGTLGTPLARTRELVWTSHTLGSELEVSVVPSGEHTTVSMMRRMRHRLRATYIALALEAGVIGGLVFGAFFGELANEEAIGVLSGLAAGVGIATLTARALFLSYRERAAQRLRALGDVIATKVRESIR